jgi:hypothetical protein
MSPEGAEEQSQSSEPEVLFTFRTPPVPEK